MIASASLHGLLILVLLVGPAFFSKPAEPVDPIITIVNATITDGPTRGGGNPMAQQAPPPAPAQIEQPAPEPTPPPVREPEPPKPQPKPPEPKPEPEPERQEPIPSPKPTPVKTKEVVETPVVKAPDKTAFELRPTDRNKKPTPKPPADSPKNTASKPPEPKIQLNPVSGRKIAPTTPNNTAAESQKAAEEARRAKLARELQSGIGRIASSIQSSAASSTSIDMPGPGGEAFVNYASIVRERFDSAWRDPADVADDNANVRVQVVIDRSGTVMSARIINRSGFSTMDKSVQAALDRVRSIGVPFPSSSSDRQRTFIINFNLKSRRLTG